MARLAIMPIVLQATLVAGGCARLATMVEPMTINHPVWATDGWVYYLREVSSDGAELWRQRHDEGSGELVLDQAALDPVCDRGVFSFLYRAPEEDVGVAVECADGSRTELLSYSAGRGSLAPVASMPFLGGVALADKGGNGYAEVPRRCGTAIEPVTDRKARDFDLPITIAGKTFNVSGGDRDCGSVAWVRSPALAEGNRLFFMAAPDSLGKLPARRSDALESFGWHLVVWDGKESSAKSLTEIPGVADLAVSPDGQTVIVAVSSPEEKGGVWAVSAATGKKVKLVDDEEAYHPSFSPDGKKFVYVDNLSHLRFSSSLAG
jgi:hypothetical protein